jgi:hypothetical protein
MHRHWLMQALAAALVSLLGTGSAAANYSVGVYYYPGWSPGARGPDPWSVIKPFARLEPKLGWYRDGSPQTLETQLSWMHQYGIEFVVFDWFWHHGAAQQEQSIAAYLQAPSRKRVPFALLWANHWRMAELSDFDAMVKHWVREYLARPEYLRVDDKPVVFIFSPDLLIENAKRMGTDGRQLLERARAEARRAGLKGIYFVMATPAVEFWAKNMAPSLGFDALSAYNYHNGFNGTPESRTPPSYSYSELDKNYRMNWQWLVKNAPLPYIVPMTSGWDKRPWGGSGDPRHDQSTGSADEFETHLLAARALMDAQPNKTLRMGVICCWNEFGEGSVIEPTKRDGFSFLERVQKVFGAPPNE